MRIAIVHHWFVTRGGGERVAEAIASLFPTAELFTLVAEPHALPASLRDRRLRTSFLQRLPLARRFHRHTMPLYPEAARSLDLRGFDLVLSSDSGPVKGIRTSPGATHICYCHSPMRYLYDGYEAYRRDMGPITRALFTATASRVRRFDLAAAQRVTHFIANSHYVADRIRRVYGRSSTVIHPPIDLHLAPPLDPNRPRGPHYLAAGRLVPYKHTGLMIEACLALGRPLRIVGAGPDLPRLQALAGASPLITFLGELPTPDLWREYADARALLFAADEDFGMVPLEAQACGTPVLAFGHGGSLETVRGTGPNPTGLFFPHQTAISLAEAILRFEAAESTFSPATTRAWAETFRTERFLAEFRSFVLHAAPAAEELLAPDLPSKAVIPTEV